MAVAAMMRTVSNLTRRTKANRLQDSIDRYVPISGQDGWTTTRFVTKSRLRVDSEGSIGRILGVRESAQKRCQPLVKCDGNCNEIPVKAW